MPHAGRPADAPGIIGLYRAFWRFAAGRRGRIVASSALLVGSQLIKLGIPWLAAQAINAIQLAGNDNLRHAGWLMLAIFGTCVVSWALHGPGRIMERAVAIRVRENLADDLYARLGRAPLEWHEQHHTGDTLHRVNQTTHALSDFAQNQFIYLQNFVNLVGPIIALLLLSAITGGAALAGYALIALVIMRFDAVMMRIADAENRAERSYSAALVDALGNVSTVLALRLQEATRRLLGARLIAVFEPLRRSIVVNESKWCAVDLLSIALWCALVGLYAWLAQRGGDTLLLGNVFMVFQYTQQAGGVIVSIAANYQQFVRYSVDYASAAPIWAAPAPPSAGGTVPSAWREIGVEALTFTHPRRRGAGPSLSDVSLTFRRGEHIALVGESGAGKSTLLRVLAGLYAPEHIAIRVDGTPQPELRSLASVAMLIPQDAEVFEGTILQNITFGETHPADDIRRACEIAALMPILDALPNGLETVITERGLNFSGGQKQRLALARGLLAARSASVLLLDEPTSSLDSVIEARIVEAILAANADACVVASVHRLHLLSRFHRVVFMADGRVLDDGPVEALVRRQPQFGELYRKSLDAGGEGASG
jgi:ATP-binding cassette subfamily B protein